MVPFVTSPAGTLTQPQFDVLYALLRAGAALTQRQIHESTGMSLGSVNTAVRECEALGHIAERAITDAGRRALEPYRVDNAVIMAAGLSRRFAPISYERPKGTLRVRGEVLVERQIRQLQEAGITDITLVVGYKKEYFFHLAEQLGVRIVVNDDYVTRNNNGSLWLVREELGNTYVCSSDDYFTVNPFDSHVYKAYYSAQYVEGPTQEWCLTTGPGGRITGAQVGGADAWTMLGHVYFDRAFSAAFRRILERVYHLPETLPKLWESIYIEHVKELDMVIRHYPAGVINEFDSVDEIRGFDPMFMENLDSEVFDNIAASLGCAKSEIQDFYPLKQGITNLSCHFSVAGREYVYRHPGIGTDKIVDRQAEIEALHLARDLGLDGTFLVGDPLKGWKISRFIPGAHNLDASSTHELSQAMTMARSLHQSGRTLSRSFDFIQEAARYEGLLQEHGPIDVPGYPELREKIMRLKTHADADGFPLVPSHNDFFPLNFLVDPRDGIHLIDWEYAGMSDVANDFGTMVVCAELSEERADEALGFYFGRTPTDVERRHFWSYVVFAGWCWYVWALVKAAEGDDAGEWLLIYYRHAANYVDALLASYDSGTTELPSPLDSHRLSTRSGS
ncbi:phosphotransferase [Actinomyces capricornis]|uniref:Choline kinase n=1 Tax=Actinomyces capricornis TaxID=2755559 RepID=A0ABM7U885_9ACTO|nr:phosphotransferase [Actinomyces capricornis]BDA63677.1 choline kinase [Actinomyces capricornis]